MGAMGWIIRSTAAPGCSRCHHPVRPTERDGLCWKCREQAAQIPPILVVLCSYCGIKYASEQTHSCR